MDRHSQPPKIDNILGIRLVEHYDYLGVTIQDTLQCDLSLQKKADKKRKLQKSTWILKNRNIDNLSKYVLWSTLFKSKVIYELPLLTRHSQKAKQWQQKFYYQQIKTLFNIRGKPSMELTILATTGLKPDYFTQAEERLFLKALTDKNDLNLGEKIGLE